MEGVWAPFPRKQVFHSTRHEAENGLEGLVSSFRILRCHQAISIRTTDHESEV